MIVRESLTKKAFKQRLEGSKRGVMKISEGRGFEVEGIGNSLGKGMSGLFQEQHGGLEQRGQGKG